MFFSVLFCTVRLSIFERFVFASFEPLRFCKKVRFVFPDLKRKRVLRRRNFQLLSGLNSISFQIVRPFNIFGRNPFIFLRNRP